jgi:hypothetical protein
MVVSDALLAAAAGQPTVRAALDRYLAERGGDVYADPAAFERFIDGGGNVALYREAAGALRDIYAELQPRRVVDIGCGDGRLTSALAGSGVGQFDPAQPRHTWEQPVEAWSSDLVAAGFHDVHHRRLRDYWWPSAHIIEASGALTTHPHG